MPFGPNAPLVCSFIYLLGAMPIEDRATVLLHDPSQLLACSARKVMWDAAYQAALDALRTTGRMNAAGSAWNAVREVLGDSAILWTARRTADALVVWELLTLEQRVAMWEPFRTIAGMPAAIARAS